MERKEAMLKTGSLRIFWAVMAVVLCAVPSVQAETVLAGDTLYINKPAIGGFLDVYGIANVDTDFYADWGIYAYQGSTVNIQGGTIRAGYGVTLTGYPYATVTVYGTDFAVTSGTIEPDGSWKPGSGSGTLTGTYENGDPISLLFYSYAAINLVDTGGPGPGPITVQIDIKPGSYPNPINPGSNGVIPVAILTTDSFDASTVDPGTVTLAGAEVAVRGKSEKSMARLEDVDGDGDNDLLLQVETQSDGTVWEAGPVTLTGETYDGQDIEGTDEVVIVPPE